MVLCARFARQGYGTERIMRLLRTEQPIGRVYYSSATLLQKRARSHGIPSSDIEVLRGVFALR